MKVVVYDSEAQVYAEVLQDFAAEHEIVAAATYEAAMNSIDDADALFALAPWITDELVSRGRRLSWIQALTTGVDTFDRLPSLRDDVILSSARGVHGPQMAEMAILLMLSLARDFPAMLANQRERAWQRWPQRLLWQRTVCIVGLGLIAEEMAGRCRALGMRVTGVSTRERAVAGFERVHARAELATALGQCDFAVVLTPYTPETHHMIDAAAIGAMRPDAYLVNLARGGVVDEAALLRALRTSAIAGAAMDVFAQEPLPPDDPMWTAPRLLVTAHMGGFSDCYPHQLRSILEHNIRAVARGDVDAMRNRVRRSIHASRDPQPAEQET